MSAIYFFAFSLFLFSGPFNTASAESPWKLYDMRPQESGLNGYIQLLGGGYNVNGQNSVDSENRQIEDLESYGNDYQQEFITAHWELDYRFDQSDTSVFIGTPNSGVTEFDIPLELGVRHFITDEFRISASYLPRLSDIEVWEDPFLTKQDRQRTDLMLEFIRFSAEYILGSPFSLMYDYGEQTIENDRSGESLKARLSSAELKKLQRNSTFSSISFLFTLPLTDKFYIVTGANYIRANAQGESNSYETTEFDITLSYQRDPFGFFAYVYRNNSEYQEINPVFYMKRQDSGYGVITGISYFEPFGWGNTTVDLIVSNTRRDSNIRFYDNREESLAFGLTYLF
jgi:hypothetical protein